MSRRCSRPPLGVRTISEAWDRCPFRSLVALVPGTRDELLDRMGAAFAAVGGEVVPIEPETLASLVETLRRGRTVVVLDDRADLRDAAKTQLMAAVNTAIYGAAGSA